MGLFAEIRESTEHVAARARSVAIDEERAAALGEQLLASSEATFSLDPTHRRLRSEADTLAFVIVMDAINFGSGWFPLLAKKPGLSGYRTLAGALREHFETHGVWTSAQLTELGHHALSEILGQATLMNQPEVAELMKLYAEALQSLGRWLDEKYAGHFEGPVEEASGCAERLAALLGEMPFYRDAAVYDERTICFYKRAQITASDLAGVFGNEGWGSFEDLETTTIFADNLVPHVLRCEGVLQYDDDLLAQIDRGELLVSGSPEEIEIRACAVHAVERMVVSLRDAGNRTSPRELDGILWNRGQRPEIKAHPRHRTRCVFY